MTAAKVQSIAQTFGAQEFVTAQPILLSSLRIAPWNARKTFEPSALAELGNTISSQGLLVPLLVRPLPVMTDIMQHPEQAAKGGDAFEIVAGHRRFLAVEKLNWKSVSCVVRELDDDQAREIGLVDNLQREDVPALEEADAYAELKKRLGTPAAIAARVGKEVSYVARRLQLVSLGENPRNALAERLITVDHALLLARLGEDEQDVNLKWALNVNAGIKVPVGKVIEERIADLKNARYLWEPQSPARLKEHIEEHVGRKLSRAPWSLDDTALIKDVPACNNCPSNTAHNDTLFGDMNIAAATCEDGGCFEMKRVAFVSIKLSDATVKQDGRGPAVRLSWKATTVKPRFSEAKAGSVMVDESGVNLLQVFKVGQWIEAKPKSCAHLRLGVTIDWSDGGDRGYMGRGDKLRKPGQQLTVCIAPGCKAHKKEWEKPKSENRNAPYDAKAEAEKDEKKRLAALAETKLRVRIAGEAIVAVKSLHVGMLREILIDRIPTGRDREAFNAILPGVETILRAAKMDSAEFARAVALLNVGRDCIEVWRYHEATHNRKEFVAAMKRLGFDASKAWDKQAAPKPAKKAVKKPAKKSAKKGGRK